MQEKIPIEVIVRFTEKGEIRPLKVNFGDKIYQIDKEYNKSLATPKGSLGVALEYSCLICGKRRKIYFDRYENLWYIMKRTKEEKILVPYNPLNYDIFND